ncbi:MAG: hypothetical protein COB67_10410, partial [SAR324 cluster bacterium]
MDNSSTQKMDESLNPFDNWSIPPKNTWEILSWLLFQPKRLKNFSDSLGRKEGLKRFFSPYLTIFLFSFFLFEFGLFIMVVGDLPLLFPEIYNENLVMEWPSEASWLKQWLWLHFWNDTILFIRWCTAMALGLILAAVSGGIGASGMVLGLVIELTLGLLAGGVSLVYPLAEGVAGGLALGLTGGVAFGLELRLTAMLIDKVLARPLFKQVFSLPFGLILGLALGLAIAWRFSLATGLAAGLAFVLFFSAGWLAIWEQVICQFRNPKLDSLFKNPYTKRETVQWEPRQLNKLLLKQCWDNPERGLQFAEFLILRRPLQLLLSNQILHKVCASYWYHFPLNFDLFRYPILSVDKKVQRSSLTYTPDWESQIEKCAKGYRTFEQQQHSALKKKSFLEFQDSLQELRAITLAQAGDWKEDYLKALDRWLQQSKLKLEEIEEELALTQPISLNFFQFGEALHPIREVPRTFVGRDRVLQELTMTIRTSSVMPTLFFQGQRRVGKSSLINFLQEQLGPGFLILSLDMQSSIAGSWSSCWNHFLDQLAEKIEEDSPEELSGDHALEVWRQFEIRIKEKARQLDKVIILALDEYEGLHHLLKSHDPDEADRLLQAMRSFSQHQNQVVLLFTGQWLSQDLPAGPRFGDHFVHTRHI